MLDRVRNADGQIVVAGSSNTQDSHTSNTSPVSHHAGHPIVRDQLPFDSLLGHPTLVLGGQSIRLSEFAIGRLNHFSAMPFSGVNVPVVVNTSVGTIGIEIGGGRVVPDVLAPGDYSGLGGPSSLAKFVKSFFKPGPAHPFATLAIAESSVSTALSNPNEPDTTALSPTGPVVPQVSACLSASQRHRLARLAALELINQHCITTGVASRPMKESDMGFLQCLPVTQKSRNYVLSHRGTGERKFIGGGIGRKLAVHLQELHSAASILASAVSTMPGRPRFVSQAAYAQSLENQFLPSRNCCGALSIAHLVDIPPDWFAVRADAAMRLYDSADWSTKRRSGAHGYDIEDALNKIDSCGIGLEDIQAILDRLGFESEITLLNEATVPTLLEQYPALLDFATQDAESGVLTMDWDAACQYLCVTALSDGGIFIKTKNPDALPASLLQQHPTLSDFTTQDALTGETSTDWPATIAYLRENDQSRLARQCEEMQGYHLTTLVRNSHQQPFNMDSALLAPEPVALMLEVLLPVMKVQLESDGGFAMLYLKTDGTTPVDRENTAKKMYAAIRAEGKRRFSDAFSTRPVFSTAPVSVPGTSMSQPSHAPVTVPAIENGVDYFPSLSAEIVEDIIQRTAVDGKEPWRAASELASLMEVNRRFNSAANNVATGERNRDVHAAVVGKKTLYLANDAGLLHEEFRTGIRAMFTGKTGIELRLDQVKNVVRRQIILDELSLCTDLKALNIVMRQRQDTIAHLLDRLPVISRSNTGLQEFSVDVSYNSIDDAALQTLGTLLNLTALKLQNISMTAVSIPSPGFQSLAQLPVLTSLDVSHNVLGGLAVAPLAGSNSLTDLNLANTSADDAGIGVFASNRNLRTLDLSGNHLITSVTAHLFEMHGTPLHTLFVAYCNFGPIGANHISRTGISELNIRGNGLGGIGVSHLANMSELKVLDVSDNYGSNRIPPRTVVGSLAGRRLATLSLESLTIANNCLGDAGLVAFKNHPTLVFLNACNNGTNVEARRDMHANSGIRTLILD